MGAPRVAEDRVAQAWRVLGSVLDPEVPALSVVDLGIVREVVEAPDGGLDIALTPTYSGCPATEAIQTDIRSAIEAAGLGPVRTTQRLAPAWTSDWISTEGKRKLAAYGIAPPPVSHVATIRFYPVRPEPVEGLRQAQPERSLACPRCASLHTERLSVFGSTACKATYRCLDCREPFEYFKPI
jgi:ring-1,2-phenylacetyl-CoA epoxidase subunit PaaD